MPGLRAVVALEALTVDAVGVAEADWASCLAARWAVLTGPWVWGVAGHLEEVGVVAVAFALSQACGRK